MGLLYIRGGDYWLYPDQTKILDIYFSLLQSDGRIFPINPPKLKHDWHPRQRFEETIKMKRNLLFAFLILGFCAVVILALFGEDIEVNREILIHDYVMSVFRRKSPNLYQKFTLTSPHCTAANLVLYLITMQITIVWSRRDIFLVHSPVNM